MLQFCLILSRKQRNIEATDIDLLSVSPAFLSLSQICQKYLALIPVSVWILSAENNDSSGGRGALGKKAYNDNALFNFHMSKYTLQ